MIILMEVFLRCKILSRETVLSTSTHMGICTHSTLCKEQWLMAEEDGSVGQGKTSHVKTIMHKPI